MEGRSYDNWQLRHFTARTTGCDGEDFSACKAAINAAIPNLDTLTMDLLGKERLR
jgi:hypothetical protein